MGRHEDKVEAMIRNLPGKTGRTLDEWIELVVAEGPAAAKERREWLKTEHGLGHFQARLVVSRIG